MKSLYNTTRIFLESEHSKEIREAEFTFAIDDIVSLERYVGDDFKGKQATYVRTLHETVIVREPIERLRHVWRENELYKGFEQPILIKRQ